MINVRDRLLRVRNRGFKYCFVFVFEKVLLFILKLWSTFYFSLKRFLYNVDVGKDVQIWGNISLRGPGKIEIGNNVKLVSSSWRCSSSALPSHVSFKTFTNANSEIIIGSDVSLNGTSITARAGKVLIGDGTIVAPGCMIINTDFHEVWPPDNRESRPGFENDRDVIVGKNVWIGSRCIILKGVEIGDNSIIAAGSVVNKSIPPNALVSGNPAVVKKKYIS